MWTSALSFHTLRAKGNSIRQAGNAVTTGVLPAETGPLTGPDLWIWREEEEEDSTVQEMKSQEFKVSPSLLSTVSTDRSEVPGELRLNGFLFFVWILF